MLLMPLICHLAAWKLDRHNFGFADKSRAQLQELVPQPETKKTRVKAAAPRTRSQKKEQPEQPEEQRKREEEEAAEKWKKISEEHHKEKEMEERRRAKEQRSEEHTSELPLGEARMPSSA